MNRGEALSALERLCDVMIDKENFHHWQETFIEEGSDYEKVKAKLGVITEELDLVRKRAETARQAELEANERLRETCQQLEGEMQKHGATRASLEDKELALQRMRRELESFASELKQSLISQNKADSTIKELQDKLAASEKEMRDRSDTASQLKSELKATKRDLQALQGEHKEVKNVLASCELNQRLRAKECEALRKDVTDSKNAAVEYRQQISQLQDKVAALVERGERLQDEVLSAQREARDHAEKEGRAREALVDAQEAMEAMREEAARARVAAEDVDALRESLKTAQQRLRDEKSLSADLRSDMENAMKQARDRDASKEQDIARLEGMLKEERDKVASLREENSKLTGELKEKLKTLAAQDKVLQQAIEATKETENEMENQREGMEEILKEQANDYAMLKSLYEREKELTATLRKEVRNTYRDIRQRKVSEARTAYDADVGVTEERLRALNALASERTTARDLDEQRRKIYAKTSRASRKRPRGAKNGDVLQNAVRMHEDAVALLEERSAALEADLRAEAEERLNLDRLVKTSARDADTLAREAEALKARLRKAEDENERLRITRRR